MNIRVLSIALIFCCASLVVARDQEPPGCAVNSSHLAAQTDRSTDEPAAPKRRVIDLRTKKHKTKKKAAKHASSRRSEREPESDGLHGPILASPVYLPQTEPSSAAAITESRGFLYIVVGQKLYKVDEKTLRTVQTSQLGRLEHAAIDTDVPKKRHRIVASTEEEPGGRKVTKKKRGANADD